MEVFYKGRKHRTIAYGDFNPETGHLTVKKGSIVSETIAPFRDSKKIRSLRNGITDESGLLLKDIDFSNPSIAASFVAGYSVNGYLAWHVGKHTKIKDVLSDMKGKR